VCGEAQVAGAEFALARCSYVSHQSCSSVCLNKLLVPCRCL
jgi:hypothetical protein